MVSVIKHLSKHVSSSEDEASPGIVLANTGQLLWWPEGKRPLTFAGYNNLPLPSLVHLGRWIDPKTNFVRGNESEEAHVKYIFQHVIPSLASDDVVVDVVALCNSVETVTGYLHDNWSTWASRIGTMAMVAGYINTETFDSPDFKEFLRNVSSVSQPMLQGRF